MGKRVLNKDVCSGSIYNNGELERRRGPRTGNG